MARAIWDNIESEQLAEAAHYNANELATLLNRSPRHVRRQSRYLLGYSPQAWLDRLRMLRAPSQLPSSDSVKQAAANLGFKTSPHFCRLFKEYYKVTASEYLALNKSRVNASRPETPDRSYCI